MLSVKQLFLLDGVGALVTCGLLAGVLTTWEPVFGMPIPILIPLAVVAAGFAVYSLTCFATGRGPRYLLAIATANALYCVVTLTLVYTLAHSLTSLGVAYFIGEVVIVMSLVTVEVRAGRGQMV